MDRLHREQKAHGTWEFPFQIYSAPDAKDSDLVPYHWHPETEIITVVRGEVDIVIGDGRYTGVRGDVFFVGSGELHEIRGGQGNLFRSFVFPLDFLQFRREDAAQSGFLQPLEDGAMECALLVPHGTAAGNQIFAELSRIMETFERQQPGYQLLIKAGLLRILAIYASAGLLHTGARRSAAYHSETLRGIIEYLGEHYTEPLSLSEISARFGLTPQYFCTFFKAHLGRTFVQHINLLRVERASRMLKETDLPVMEVGFNVGYENFSYFIKRFREVFGCTPTEYRRQSGWE